ncbi:NUDIX domain-containing protein [Hyphomicrobium sp. 99]|uniref:NUDIX domain-containing protein n=1 Tax=Hyphomicrobium sp. 99 TaxID=1163419 RepID=UPI0005F792A3|nr:NUDIX domain-containing protein [Hyphomicrobium sp. 99]
MREDRFLVGQFVARAFQQYWRLTRGVYLNVEAFVMDEAGRILLVREEVGGKWSLPASTVQKGESLETALRRLIRDAAGIEVNSKPELRGFYAESRSRQTGMYVIRNWQPHSVPGTLEMNFFAPYALPADVTKPAAARISRLVEGRTISQT